MGTLPHWLPAAATSMEINVGPTKLFGLVRMSNHKQIGGCFLSEDHEHRGNKLAFMGSGFETE